MTCYNKISSKKYYCWVETIKDPFNELTDDCYLTFPEGLLEEMGWKEGDNVNLEVKMGTHGNVLVIIKEKS